MLVLFLRASTRSYSRLTPSEFIKKESNNTNPEGIEQ